MGKTQRFGSTPGEALEAGVGCGPQYQYDDVWGRILAVPNILAKFLPPVAAWEALSGLKNAQNTITILKDSFSILLTNFVEPEKSNIFFPFNHAYFTMKQSESIHAIWYAYMLQMINL